jgi:Na+/H+ antiporter NhaD/arsenite permease-like protein
MKKLLTGLSAFLLFSPLHVFAADGALSDTALGNTLPLWSCIPFAGMLLSIAIFPLVKEEWWEKHKPWVVAFWSLLFLIPFAVIFGGHIALEHLIEVTLGDYLTFIVLLFGLFCVAGNISLQGDLTGSPKVNVVLLLIGTLLSSWIGTTGASMLMIRPIIRANKWRQRKVQNIERKCRLWYFSFSLFLISAAVSHR